MHRGTFKDTFGNTAIEEIVEFYDAIDDVGLARKLSAERPYTYWTMEVYDKANGIKGGGGLGVLAADTRRCAEKVNIPFVMLTPFYPWEGHQKMENLEQTEYHVEVRYEDFGFTKIGETEIKSPSGPAKLDIVEKVLGSTRFLCVTEPNFGELYSGEGNSDHRLYQEVALGFGGYSALKIAGLKPAVMQLNEVATFFAAVARLDELVKNGMDFYEAMVYVRSRTLYTNHTLVQAAEAEFTYDQFEKYVFPNISSRAVKKWLSDKFNGGRLRLSAVTIEIALYRNGVSKLHARVANYRDINGDKVKFKAVTNGIDMDTWVSTASLRYLRENGIIDQFDLPTADYEARVDNLKASDIRRIKDAGRAKMNEILARRTDQYGNPVVIPDGALVFEFKRRFVDYKRPWLPFTDVDRISRTLEENDAYYLLSGKAHMGDRTMYGKLKDLLAVIDANPILKKRVHYLPDYDEELGVALSLGSNASINCPIVGLEACGTSWMKDIANMGIVISTADGGVADMPASNYLEISGENEAEEVESLYAGMEKAAKAWRDDRELEEILRTELKAYIPVISGTRMLREYLEYLF